jgi:hypothetical protein
MHLFIILILPLGRDCDHPEEGVSGMSPPTVPYVSVMPLVLA